MAVLLVIIALLAVGMTELLPAWHQQNIREKEAELVFRGEQYAHAIALYRLKFSAYPTTVDQLLQGHFLRKKWKDPITGDDFDLRYAGGAAGPSGATSRPGTGGGSPAGGSTSPGGASGGARPGGASPSSQPALGSQGGGIVGVMSKSTDESILVYNGATEYDQWVFVVPVLGAPVSAGAPSGAGGSGARPGGGAGGPGGGGLGPGGGRGGGRGGPGGGRGGPGDGGPGRGGGTGPGGGTGRGGRGGRP